MGTTRDRSDVFKQSELDKLYALVREYRRSDEFYRLLQVIKRFPNISPYNAFLLAQQRPGARYVMSADEWKKYNREIKPHSRPMVILQPFGPVKFVYDISDTLMLDGVQWNLFDDADERLIEELSHPYKTRGKNPIKCLDRLTHALQWFGICLDFTHNGSVLAAMIEVLRNSNEYLLVQIPSAIRMKAKPYYRITINSSADVGERFASMCHELAHMLCRHLIEPVPGFPERVCLSNSAKEFEAETAAWLVCERLGVYNPSEKYLAGYIATNEEIPDGVSPERMFSAATTLLNLSDGKTGYKDGWLYKYDSSFKEECKKLIKSYPK